MTAWLKGNNKPNQQILAYAASDGPGCGKEFVFSRLCLLRHMAARLREKRGERHGYDPCCYCPKFVTKKADKPKPEKTQEESKTMTTESASICVEPNCNNPVFGHGKTGRCRSCAARANSELAHEARRKKSKDAPKTIIKTGMAESAVSGHKDQKRASGVKAKYQEMPGVGGYCPEPATNTIHASKPPKPEPIKINEIDVCRQVINKHGISRQIAKAAEEFSEAAAAISRFLAGEGEYAEIIGEVADVEVMCVQMRMIYGTDAIDQARAEKVARLHGRLNP
jgi:hypothetical protein